MNNIIFDRIKKQTEDNIRLNKVTTAIDNIVAHQKQTPIPPTELQTTLENLFLTEKIEESKPIESLNIIFPDLFHFCEWYGNNKTKFTEIQQKALGTLVEARDLINVGCACKRQQRLNAANNYFKIFWDNNQKNDLIPTVLKISGAKSVEFGDFLRFP